MGYQLKVTSNTGFSGGHGEGISLSNRRAEIIPKPGFFVRSFSPRVFANSPLRRASMNTAMAVVGCSVIFVPRGGRLVPKITEQAHAYE